MIKKTVIGCLFVLFAQTVLAQERFQEYSEDIIQIYQGEVKVLKVDGVERIAVGDTGILTTSILNNGQLLLIAEGTGVSTLRIWFTNGSEREHKVVIMDEYGTLQKKADEVRELVKEIAGLNVRIVGERIVLSGLIDEGYAPVIVTITESFPEIMDLTRRGALNRDMPENKMVFMNIKITEFNKRYLESLGINWATSIAGPAAALALDGAYSENIRPSFDSDASFADVLQQRDPADNLFRQATSAFGYFGIATEISSRINFAVNNNNAIILAEPRLATRSGGEATFLAGGEVPYEVSNINGTTVEFKEFGIQLAVSPVVDLNNNIVASVSAELSAIDDSVSVGDVPGFLTRRTSTIVSMSSGETLVISGLINQQASKTNNGIYGLKDIPILGNLFKSTDFNDQKTELVVFVTPTVFDADSDINKEHIEWANEGIQNAIDEIDEESLDIIY